MLIPEHLSFRQGDPGEPGFPGLSGLFGPKVLSLFTLRWMETKCYQNYFYVTWPKFSNSQTQLLFATKGGRVTTRVACLEEKWHRQLYLRSMPGVAFAAAQSFFIHELCCTIDYFQLRNQWFYVRLFVNVKPWDSFGIFLSFGGEQEALLAKCSALVVCLFIYGEPTQRISKIRATTSFK